MKYIYLSLVLLFTLSLTAQLEVIPGQVGIGRVPLEDATFEAANLEHRRYGGYLMNRLNNAPASFGLYVNNFKPRGTSFGAYFYAYDNGSSLSYATTGLKINNDMRGSGSNTGLYLSLNGYGSGKKTVSYAYLADNYGGNNLSSTQPLLGHHVRLVNRSRPTSTTFLSEVIGENSSTSGKVIYGYKFEKSGSTQGTTYGVHSTVSNSHGYAGYFDGDVIITGATANMSDETLKTNIEDIAEASDLLRALRPRSYNFLEDAGLNLPTDVLSFGFLAQELEEVLPDLVVEVNIPARYGYPEGFEPSPSDTTGYEDVEREQIAPAMVKKGIRYGELVPLLVRAFQEQADLLDALPDLELLRSATTTTAAVNDKIRSLSEQNYTIQAENDAMRQELVSLRAEMQSLAEAVSDLRNCTDCYGTRPLENIEPSTGKNSVFPNPARGKITVKTTQAGDYRLVVRDAGGKEQYSSVYSTPVVSVATTNWSAGMYFIEIVVDGQVADTLKVTIVR